MNYKFGLKTPKLKNFKEVNRFLIAKIFLENNEISSVERLGDFSEENQLKLIDIDIEVIDFINATDNVIKKSKELKEEKNKKYLEINEKYNEITGSFKNLTNSIDIRDRNGEPINLRKKVLKKKVYKEVDGDSDEGEDEYQCDCLSGVDVLKKELDGLMFSPKKHKEYSWDDLIDFDDKVNKNYNDIKSEDLPF